MFILDGQEHHALGRAGPLADQHQPRKPQPSVGPLGNELSCIAMAQAVQHGVPQRQRVPPQRRPDRQIVSTTTALPSPWAGRAVAGSGTSGACTAGGRGRLGGGGDKRRRLRPARSTTGVPANPPAIGPAKASAPATASSTRCPTPAQVASTWVMILLLTMAKRLVQTEMLRNNAAAPQNCYNRQELCCSAQ